MTNRRVNMTEPSESKETNDENPTHIGESEVVTPISTEPASQYTYLLDMPRDEEAQLSNVFCDACGYVSADFVEVGLHLMECEKINTEEHLETYTCNKCKDRTEVVWGH